MIRGFPQFPLYLMALSEYEGKDGVALTVCSLDHNTRIITLLFFHIQAKICSLLMLKNKTCTRHILIYRHFQPQVIVYV
jgi:hypothetical protein